MNSGTSILHNIAWALVWVGAVNWGLIGFFEFNLVNAILGGFPVIERIIYAAVGIAALVLLATTASQRSYEGTENQRRREMPAT